MKERAVVDLFRELKWNGFSAAKWSTPIEVRQLEQIFLLPTPKLPRHEGIRQTTAGSVEKAEQYFMKCVSEMHALSSETTMLGSKYMTKRETELMVNFGYSGLMMLTQQRCLLSKALSDTQQLHTTLGVLPSSTFRLPRDQAKLCLNVQTFKERCSAAFESIQQLRLLVQTVLPSIDHTTEKEWARDVASRLGPVTRETQGTSSGMIFVTQEMLMETNQRCQELVTAQEMIRMFHRKCPDISSHLPQDPFEYCLDDIQSALEAGERCNKELEASSMDASKSDYSVDHLTYKTFQDTLSKMIESTLVCYQSLSKHTATVGFQETSDEIQDTGSISIGNCHRDASISATLIDLSKVTGDFVEVFGELRGLYSDRSASINGLECCFGLLSNAKELLVYTLELSQRALDDSVHFYFALAKLHYVILRVFRTLVSKGYCSDKTSEGDEEEGEVNGMTFGDDNDGTGMGEGDGKKDVTDQLENEDQLAGLKSDEKNDSGESKKPEQLNEEEADKGMEMEADFDGDMFDMPDDPQDKDEVEEQEKEEELDREMGDEGNADDQVVDEKMWDESDDEENLDAGQEKFEQDSGVEGDPVDDAIRTKEDQHDEPDKSPGEKNDVGNQSPDQSNEDKEGESGIQDENQDINDDLEELYEENHGVDVRGEDKENGQEDTDQNEEPMELGNDLNLDEEMNDAGADETNGDDDVIDDNNSTTEGNEQDEDPVAEQVDGTGEDHEDEETNEKTAATAAEGEMDVENGDEEHEQDDGLEVPVDISRQDRSDDAAHGIQSKDGADAVAENPDADQEEENRDDGTDFAGNPAEGKSQGDQADEHGSDGGGNSNLTNETANQLKSDKDSNDFPNPIKDPGDASKFWHRKLNVIDNAQNEEDEGTSHETTPDDKETPQEPNASDYQYSSGQADTTQVLGDTTEEEAIELEPTTNEIEYDEASKDKHSKDNSSENESSSAERSDKKVDKKPSNRDTRKTPTDRGQNDEFNDNDLDDSGFEADEKEAADNDEDASMSYSEVAVNDDDMDSGTKVVSDLSRLNVDEADIMPHTKAQIQQYEEIARVDLHEANTARSQWLAIQGETQGLARRLCEKVRLVLEPLVASKLRGDYRTGKRINMKRVIGYIASGYRKDKIWLRRTKPAKRDYRVLLAVDDSESMKKSGAGEMALRAMATVAVGMNQLEVGELGVASFGDDMKLVHPFHMPFTSESGADVVRNFKFDQQRTRISLCVESAMTALEDAGGGSSMQLVFLISDGRIERDSRSALKGLIREMLERNILLAMIIVEGNEKKKDSILNMKEVSFEKGKPIVKRFIEDYPFPYYIVLDDVATLPEVLGDALKQWFEILTQLQSPGR
jgi:midasin